MRRGGADVCALGGVKAVRWGCVLWMLVLAVANAPRFPHQMHTLQPTLISLSPKSGDENLGKKYLADPNPSARPVGTQGP